MITTKFFLCLIVSQTICQDIRSIYLSIMIDTKYECNSLNCSSSVIVLSSRLLYCQIECLNNQQCRTVTFDRTNKQCQIFVDIPSQYGTLLTRINVTTMIAIDKSPLSATTGSGNTISTSISTSTTTSTSTQTTITFTPVGIYALSIHKCATWNPNGITVAGNQNGTAGSDLKSLRVPVSIFVDNDNILTVTDRDNYRILRFHPNSTTGIIIAGNGTLGKELNQLSGPKGVAVDQYGDLIVADSDNYRIQKFQNGSRIGITLAFNTSNNPLGQMRDLHIDVNNNIYITDSDNNVVSKYIPFSSQGIILAGGGPSGNALNQLNSPYGNYMDANNSLYVADANNHRVLKYAPGSLNGIVIAGNGIFGPALNQLNTPYAAIADNNGYVYVADSQNARIVKWTTNYMAGGVCVVGCTGVSGNAVNQLAAPRDLKFDRYGHLYVTDQDNHRIQKFLINNPPPTTTC